MELFLSKTISYEIYRLVRLEPWHHIIGKLLYLCFNNRLNREIYKKEEEYYSSLNEYDFARALLCIRELECLGLLYSPRIAGMETKLSLEKIRNRKDM